MPCEGYGIRFTTYYVFGIDHTNAARTMPYAPRPCYVLAFVSLRHESARKATHGGGGRLQQQEEERCLAAHEKGPVTSCGTCRAALTSL